MFKLIGPTKISPGVEGSDKRTKATAPANFLDLFRSVARVSSKLTIGL